MYKIIGADGKEYGPITAEQMKQWIAEGRANAQTRVLLEGTADWKTLSEIPELAMFLAGSPITPAGPIPATFPGASGSDAANLVAGPAIGLIAVAVLGFLAQASSLVLKFAFAGIAATQSSSSASEAWANMFSGTLAVVGAFIGIVTSGFILFGGLKMKKLESHGLVMAASIIAMIPCVSPCCFIGIPVGIWALTVLFKPEVKSAFH